MELRKQNNNTTNNTQGQGNQVSISQNSGSYNLNNSREINPQTYVGQSTQRKKSEGGQLGNNSSQLASK